MPRASEAVEWLLRVLGQALFLVLLVALVCWLWLRFGDPGGGRWGDVAVEPHGLLAAATGVPPSSLSSSSPPTEFRNGDIISVAYHDPRGCAISLFSGSTWTHVGLVWRRKNAARSPWLVTELLGDRPKRPGGVQTMPVTEWLEHKRKHSVAVTPLVGRELSAAAIEEALTALGDRKLNGSWGRLLRTLSDRPHPADAEAAAEPRMFCCEWLVALLQRLGVAERDVHPVSYTPRALVFGELRCRDGWCYAEPRLLSKRNAR